MGVDPLQDVVLGLGWGGAMTIDGGQLLLARIFLPGTPLEKQEVSYHGSTTLGENTLRVELDAFEGVRLVPYTLNDALRAILSGHPGGELEALGQRDMSTSQGVVSRDGEVLHQALVYALAIVGQRRGLAVQPLASRVDLPAVDVKDALS